MRIGVIGPAGRFDTAMDCNWYQARMNCKPDGYSYGICEGTVSLTFWVGEEGSEEGFTLEMTSEELDLLKLAVCQADAMDYERERNVKAGPVRQV